MLENRLPGERPDRHPAAGTWERTSPRFRRDRSRRDACPTVRPRCFGVRPGFSGSEIAEQLRGVDLACFCPTRQPSGEFCGQTAGADFPGMLKIDCRCELNCLPRSITAGWRSTIDGCSTFWRISGDQHKRRRPNVIFGNGLRKLRLERKYPARSLFIPDRNYFHYQISRGADGGSRRILPSRPDCWS